MNLRRRIERLERIEVIGSESKNSLKEFSEQDIARIDRMRLSSHTHRLYEEYLGSYKTTITHELAVFLVEELEQKIIAWQNGSDGEVKAEERHSWQEYSKPFTVEDARHLKDFINRVAQRKEEYKKENDPKNIPRSAILDVAADKLLEGIDRHEIITFLVDSNKDLDESVSETQQVITYGGSH